LDTSAQLPTPRDTPQPEPQSSDPVASDSLFAVMDIDANDTGTGRTRTAASGNSLFTVVDSSGVYDMEVIFCVCSHGSTMDAQLLQSGLFPATFKQIETLFTVSVLDDFLIDNLECKTTAQQYHSKLQIMMNRMFPNNVPVCISVFVNTYLTKLHRTDTSSFSGHRDNGRISETGWKAGSGTTMMQRPFQMGPWQFSVQLARSPASTSLKIGRHDIPRM